MNLTLLEPLSPAQSTSHAIGRTLTDNYTKNLP